MTLQVLIKLRQQIDWQGTIKSIEDTDSLTLESSDCVFIIDDLNKVIPPDHIEIFVSKHETLTIDPGSSLLVVVYILLPKYFNVARDLIESVQEGDGFELLISIISQDRYERNLR